jgi:serine/threonine-protein kinase HipA
VRELKTWVSAESGPDATIEALMSVTAYFRIEVRRAKEILRQVEGAVSGWRKTGHALGMNDRDLEQFVEAFEHPEREAAKRAIR